MKITLEEHNLLRELAAEFDYPPFDEGKHVTASMLAEEIGITHRAASERLDKLVGEGVLERERIRMGNGHRAWGYYKD